MIFAAMSAVIKGVVTRCDGTAALSIGDSFRHLEFLQHAHLQVHGLHFSSSEVHISCVFGRVLVAICDLRDSSASCLRVQLLELHAAGGDGSSSAPSSVLIPAGCARGIVSVFNSAPSSTITLKASLSHPDDCAFPSTIAWNDPSLAVAWPPLCTATPSCESFSPLPSTFRAVASPRVSIASAISNSPIRCASDPYAPSVILLSGGAGFIGSHVIRHLLKKYPDYTVINFDVLDHCSTLNNLSDVAELPNYRFVHGDICNLDLVDYVFKINQARAYDAPLSALLRAFTYLVMCFRLTLSCTLLRSRTWTTLSATASSSPRPMSWARMSCLKPPDAIACGDSFTSALTRSRALECFHHASSCAHAVMPYMQVYGDVLGMDAAESSMMEPTNPYSCSKAAAEFITKAYIRSYNLPVLITRGNNVFGPCQFPEKVIPKFILRLMRGQK